MCLRFEKLPGVYRVIYPDGDFSTHGVQARHASGGKIRALNLLLDAMEREWVRTIPK